MIGNTATVRHLDSLI